VIYHYFVSFRVTGAVHTGTPGRIVMQVDKPLNGSGPHAPRDLDPADVALMPTKER
jgi:hypothetical protein